MSAYQHRLAYLHPCGEVEGFVGTGLSRENAEKDAIRQIHKKLAIVKELRPTDPEFDKSRVIKSPYALTREQLAAVKSDWQSGLRY